MTRLKHDDSAYPDAIAQEIVGDLDAEPEQSGEIVNELGPRVEAVTNRLFC
jgi:hypothetical protein